MDDHRYWTWVFGLTLLISMPIFFGYVAFLVFAPSWLREHAELLTFLVFLGIPRVAISASQRILRRFRPVRRTAAR